MGKRRIGGRCLSALLSVLLAASVCEGAAAAAGSAGGKDGGSALFTDLGNSYAKKEIEELANEKILSGEGDGKFNPKSPVTRAQLAAVLTRSLGLRENEEAARKFKDVSADAWYAGFVGALVDAGVTGGTSETTFSPNKKVTREELAVFYIRAMGLSEMAQEWKAEPAFQDEKEVSSWAQSSVRMAYGIGYISGSKDAQGGLSFLPKAQAERQALAKLAYEFYCHKKEYIAKAEEAAGVDLTEKTAMPELRDLYSGLLYLSGKTDPGAEISLAVKSAGTGNTVTKTITAFPNGTVEHRDYFLPVSEGDEVSLTAKAPGKGESGSVALVVKESEKELTAPVVSPVYAGESIVEFQMAGEVLITIMRGTEVLMEESIGVLERPGFPYLPGSIGNNGDS